MDIGHALKKDPGLGMRVVEALDVEAGAQGVSMARRLHTRAVAVEVCSRLKQSTPLFIDNCMTKTQKIIAQHREDDDVERRLAVQMGDELFQKTRNEHLVAVDRWNIGYYTTQPGVVVNPSSYQSSLSPKQYAGRIVITVGAILLGIAAISAISGALLVSSSNTAGLVLLTVGVLLGLGGLVTLIVGLFVRYT